MSENKKLKLGIYWAASCGGCDVAITHINEKILDLIGVADIVFWPCAMDFKYDDVRRMSDGEIDVCLINGAIRNSDHLELAELLRRKSKTLVALGACACLGGIPGLSNVTTAEESLSSAYYDAPSAPNTDRILPLVSTQVPEGILSLPQTWDTVHTLAQVVEVDYFVPGCPPTPEIIGAAIDAIVSGELPARGATLAPAKALCDECVRVKKNDMRVSEFKAPWQIRIDPDQCLIEQGLLCAGPATRSGCGAQCPKANMPCSGCFGPPEGIDDQGAALLGALASVLCPDAVKGLDAALDGIQDPIGSFYRFSLPASILRRAKTAN